MRPFLLCAALAAAGPPSDPPEAGFELPPSSVARALAGIGPDTRPAAPAAPLAGAAGELPVAAPGPDADGAWEVWASSLRKAAEGGAAERAWLALFAHDLGRWEDAWQHVRALSDRPELMALVLPRLLPGAPAGSPAADGGLPGPLPDGVVLRPALPPIPQEADPVRGGQLTPREAWARGVRVGDATLDVRVALEWEGVQVDIVHTGGGPATLAVVLPEPPGLEVRLEYVDWLRQDTRGEPLVVAVAPGDEPHTLYGRTLPRRVAWPTGEIERAPAQLALGGLRFRLPPDAERAARVRALAAATGRLFDVPTWVGIGPPEPSAVWAPLDIDLSDPAVAREKLAWLVSRLEGRLLD